MKTLLFIVITTLIAATATAQDAKTYSNYQYPYTDLLAKSKQVLVLSSVQGIKVKCRVKIVNEQTWISDYRLVDEDDFNAAPLKACMSRDEAKKKLRDAYATS